jgi:CheY-like chemotaxis protein
MMQTTMMMVLIAAAQDVVDLARVTHEDASLVVIDAPDAHRAIARAQVFQPELVIVDEALGGRDVCRQLRADADFARTPIVLLTSAPAAGGACLAAGATGCLTKPVSPVRLISLVERLLPDVALWPPR